MSAVFVVSCVYCISYMERLFEQMGGEVVECMFIIIKPETMVVGKLKSFSLKTCTVMPINMMSWREEVVCCHGDYEDINIHPITALTACQDCGVPTYPYMYYGGAMLYPHALYIKILFNYRYIKIVYFQWKYLYVLFLVTKACWSDLSN